jgi:hypothetical protein
VLLALGLRVGGGGGVNHEHCARIRQLPTAISATPSRPSPWNAFMGALLLTRKGPGRDVIGTLCAANASSAADFVFLPQMWQT